jgi:Rha family phage regulatory protein
VKFTLDLIVILYQLNVVFLHKEGLMINNKKAAGCGDTQTASSNAIFNQYCISSLADIEVDVNRRIHSHPLIVHGGKAAISIDSRSIATEFGRRHDNVLQTIKQLIDENTISFLEFKECSYSKNGRAFPCYELTEKGFFIAMPFIGGRKSKEGQVRLVNEFFKLRKQLEQQMAEKTKLPYQAVRCSGKDARMLLTDTIQAFVIYAKSSGSQNADRYYSIITNTIYRSFLVIDPKIENVRELLTTVQLSRLQTAELIAADALAQGMENNLYYKDIAQQIKRELESICTSKTKVIGV